MEAVHSKAPSTLTSALLAEPREDVNVRLLGTSRVMAKALIASLPYKSEVWVCFFFF